MTDLRRDPNVKPEVGSIGAPVPTRVGEAELKWLRQELAIGKDDFGRNERAMAMVAIFELMLAERDALRRVAEGVVKYRPNTHHARVAELALQLGDWEP